jgi:hypothetical protein
MRGSVSTGAKEDESSTGRVWAAGFRHVTVRFRLAGVFKLKKKFICIVFKTFSGRGKPRILDQWIRGHDCTLMNLSCESITQNK